MSDHNMTWETLLCVERQQKKEEKPKQFKQFALNEFDDDYLSIISSQAFRRLQDKTQVFPLDKSDFVRTRLTHSMEVSAIAGDIARMITSNTGDYKVKELTEDPALGRRISTVVACAGLLHDTGNPPFGHYGEEVIREWFKKKLRDADFCFRDEQVGALFDRVSPQLRADFENFEGNAQGLRILSKAGLRQGGHDVNLTYAVINTLIKYPNPSTRFNKKSPNVEEHKMGYYYAEREIMDALCEKTGTRIGEEQYVRHPLVYIMEAADDIAYATADLADSVKKGRFTVQEFIDHYEKEANAAVDAPMLTYIETKKDDPALYEKLKRYFALHDLMRKKAAIQYELKDENLKDALQAEIKALDAERTALFQTPEEHAAVTELEKIKDRHKYARNMLNPLKKAVRTLKTAGTAAEGSVFRRTLTHSDTPEEEFAIFENWLEGLRQWLAYGAQSTFLFNYKKIMRGQFHGELTEGNYYSDMLHILKRTMAAFVYDSHEIVSLELSARTIMESLLEDFVHAVMYADERDEKEHMTTIDDRFVHMIPDNFKMDYLGAKETIEQRVAAGQQTRDAADAEELYLRFLMVTDYISGMTDSYARNLYRITNGME